MFPVRQKDAPREIHRVHPHTWNYLVIVLWNTIRIFAASARVAFLAGWMYRRPSTGAPEIALIATASFIASSAQKPTLPASTKRLRSSGVQVRSTMQLSHYTALTSQYEANRRIRHDILHHVNTIRYLLANGQQQEATEYAGQLLAENQRSSQLGQCDNPVIDAFLYGRVQEAKAQGITVETHIILPVELSVSNTDLVIVFGNLMDNAVEACAKLENPKNELNAHIGRGYLVITESNPAVPEPEGRKQRRIPELERGVGMQILKSVAEKYQGSCMSETGNGNYSVSVFLKLVQAKEGNAIYAENSCV